MSTTNSLAAKVADVFNRHGKFTARVIEHELAIEVRYADTGDVAATLWIADEVASDQWMWLGEQPGMGTRYLPKYTPLDVLVPAVATHVLDEAVNR